MSTTSGRRRRTRSTAARPSPASPTTVRSGSASTMTRKPVRSSRWSSAMRTVIGPSRRRGRLLGGRGVGARLLVLPGDQGDGDRPRRALAGAARRRDAGGRPGGARPPGARRRRRGSRRRRPRRRGGWRRSPACRRGRRRRRSARRRRGPTRSASPSPPAAVARCMSIAQRTAATALAKTTMSPSPVDLTSRPPWAATAARSASKCARRSASARSSPTRSNSDAEPTRSVKRIVTNSGSIGGEHHRRRGGPRHPPGGAPSSRFTRAGDDGTATRGPGSAHEPPNPRSRARSRHASLHGARRASTSASATCCCARLLRAGRPPHGRQRLRARR